MSFDPGAAARHLPGEHARRAQFANFPAALALSTLDEAYAAQAALEVLAWTANLLGERGRGLRAGQIVMTGSVIATLPAVAGKTFRFAVEGLGETVLAVE